MSLVKERLREGVSGVERARQGTAELKGLNRGIEELITQSKLVARKSLFLPEQQEGEATGKRGKLFICLSK